MALIKCPDCGREVSSRAKSCPQCGCPIAEETIVPAAPASAPAGKKGESPEERQVILLHLQDLRALELLKQKYGRTREWAMKTYGITEFRSMGTFLPQVCVKAGCGPNDALGLQLQDEYSKRLKVMVQLSKAYELNLIPKPFRNLYGVYYLYDYLSTSQESLTDALLHLDLEQIKDKLDHVIAQQSEQILRAAVQSAQLAHIQKQFDQLIDTVQSISTDTAAIARYSAISAAHLETIKILQLLG